MNDRRLSFVGICIGILFVLSGCWDQEVENLAVLYPYSSLVIDPSGCSCTSDNTPTETACSLIKEETNLQLVACKTVYASTQGGGVVRTTDGGATWETFSNGLFDPKVARLTMDPVTPTRLYAGTEDGGIFWIDVDQLLVWKAQFLNPIPDISDVVVDPNPNQCLENSPPCRTIYVASRSEGVFRSADQGDTWQLMTTNGLTEQAVSRLALDPFAGLFSRLYAGTEGGHVFSIVPETDPLAGTWVEGTPGLTANTPEEVISLKVSPAAPNTLFAGIGGGEGGVGGGGVFRSDNFGQNWQEVSIPTIKKDSVFVIEFLQLKDLLVLYVSVSGLSRATSQNNFNFWETIDVGREKGVTALAVDPFAGTTLYAGTFIGELFRSTNGAATGTKDDWTEITVNPQ